jgi:hypothetical protein
VALRSQRGARVAREAEETLQQRILLSFHRVAHVDQVQARLLRGRGYQQRAGGRAAAGVRA